MIRTIIHIDEDKCNGCGLCATSCHEGAIDIIEGKAKLVRENFCDGFGDCLPNCPTNAISFEEREAPEYDDAAVKKTQEEAKRKAMAMTVEDIMQIQDENERRKLMMAKTKEKGETLHAGCPGSKMMQFDARDVEDAIHAKDAADVEKVENAEDAQDAKDSQDVKTQSAAANFRGNFASSIPVSRLRQWPCQIKLVPVQAPFFDDAKLLIAADCTAYAYANMHEEFMKGKVTLIGCPKLDSIDYSEKLTEIITNNDIKEVTIMRMEVPCCGGLEAATKNALQASGKFLPWHVVTISCDGTL